MLTKHELARQIAQKREAIVIVNTASRQGARHFRHVCKGLQARGITIVESHAVKRPSRIPKLVERMVAAGHRLICVGGGDGTISSMVGAFAYRDSVLGLLPLGTGNSFAQTIEIQHGLEEALDVIALGRVADIDLGKVNGSYFSNIATIGLSAKVAMHTPTFLKRYTGPLAYLLQGCIETFRHGAFRAEIQDDTAKIDLLTHQLIIANGNVFGASTLGPEAHVDNRRLALITLHGENRWQVAKMWFSLLTGQLERFKDTEVRQITNCTITTDPKQPIDVDGESPITTPAEFSVAVGALRILVPASFIDRPSPVE